MRVILGIQEAHDASAALMVDGKIVAAAQEERFTGLKGDYGFPDNAIQACLKEAGLGSGDLDEVVLSSHKLNPVLTKIKRNANFSVDDWVKEQREFWKPRIFENRSVPYYDLFKDRSDFRYDSCYPMDDLLSGYSDSAEMEKMAQVRFRTASEKLDVDPKRIRTVTHEDCHVFYSYYASPLRGRVLALTSEGIGDYSNGSVSLIDEAGRKELSHTNQNHLGHIYQYITLLLGMKPNQHEYKVMGLAPYANSREIQKSYKVFEHILKVDGLDIVFDQKPKDLYFHFRDALEGHRFDGMAGAVQQFTEEILCRWVSACVRVTGENRICFSGGVSQNIKACKSIAELPEVSELYVCQAAGDTSLPIGACYLAMWEFVKTQKLSTDLLRPLDHMYLGPAVSNDEVDKAISARSLSSNFKIVQKTDARTVAEHLAAGKIIGRCSGRMEFGLRALGNRSILADPRRPEMIQKINDAIKYRDFWMPFTPSILSRRAKDYLVNPKNLRCPSMTMAFDTTKLAREHLAASLHPADHTARPQILEREHNPEYFSIIEEFERITGVGGVLNTSFNLHGDPIVCGPKEAIRTLEESELDGVLLGNTLIMR